jgi:hypothetical protein
MAQGVDVASAVGTWLAAGPALIALFGIIAPFLLWIVLRSERHIASRAIDDPLHLFVSSGIPIWYNTRILRRARVPRLTNIPQIPEGFNGQRKDECLKDRPSRTGWIRFCSALRAFSLPGSNDRRGTWSSKNDRRGSLHTNYGFWFLDCLEVTAIVKTRASGI